MIVGVPTEIKDAERRVGLTPNSVRDVSLRGHDVLIQKGAGLGSGFTDLEYESAGAKLIDTADELFVSSQLIVKVKEPQAI